MYISNSALATVFSIVVLVKAQDENDESHEQYKPGKGEKSKENIYTELSDFYTFVALIDIVFKDHSKRTCTGAIIHDNVVITAAHCFLGKDRYSTSKPELTASFVVIGTKTMFETGYEQYLPIEKIVTHPLFEGWTADLALVYTFAGMTSDKPGSIIALAGDMSAHVDSNVTVYSWGEENEDESNSDETLKEEQKKTTAYESCSEDDESGSLIHKSTKNALKRFRNSDGDENKSNRPKIFRVADKSIERLGMKRTAMFYGNKLWSRSTNFEEAATTAKSKKFYKTEPLHHRAKEDKTKQRVENIRLHKQFTKGFNDPEDNSLIGPGIIKQTPDEDYSELTVDKITEEESQTTKRRSRYLADDIDLKENLRRKPQKLVPIDFKDSYEKALVKKHFPSSKSTKNEYRSKKHTYKFRSTEIISKNYQRVNPNRYAGKGHHLSRPEIKNLNVRKKIKTKTKSVEGRKRSYRKYEKENPQGWRRSLGSQQNQLFVGSFGYVNIQSCRALVEKAMPAKYEISNANDAICYTSTKRCIRENDSGAPAVRQGQLIAVTVGGAECEGDHVAVGMKMNCYCSWISDNLPPGSNKFECCKNCCDLKHKGAKGDKSKEKQHKTNKKKQRHKQ